MASMYMFVTDQGGSVTAGDGLVMCKSGFLRRAGPLEAHVPVGATYVFSTRDVDFDVNAVEPVLVYAAVF